MDLLDILADTLIDNLKLFVFLLITYLFLEYMEQKMSERTAVWVKKAGAGGPFIGSLCGTLPQCGFAAAASNFYAARLISIGTLIAIYLSTSDEMLPILISGGISYVLLAQIIGYKFVCGVIFGYAIDYFWRKKHAQPVVNIEQLCEDEHCHCDGDEGIWRPAFVHAFHITMFIFAVTLALNVLFFYIHPKALTHWLQIPVLSEIMSGIFGLLPNCSASVILTQLYLENILTLSALFSGSLVNGGVGLLVLFRVNRNMKENLLILALLYVCGISGGLLSRLVF